MILFPAGLMDSQVEIFGADFKANCLAQGKRLTFKEFPDTLKKSLQDKLDANPRAQRGLNEWGVPPDEQLERFAFCMYGGFDNLPDFSSTNELSEHEYHNHCGRRGKCEFEGKCCGGLVVENGKLTAREVEIAILIGKCYSDKWICFELEISQETLRNHKNSIERKAGISGKVAIGILAHKYKLI